MRRNHKNTEGDIAIILRDGDGARLWEVFHAESLKEDDHRSYSPSELRFLLLIERYMARHRLTIATAHGRFLMRKWMKPFQKRYHALGPVVRLPIQPPPATM